MEDDGSTPAGGEGVPHTLIKPASPLLPQQSQGDAAPKAVVLNVLYVFTFLKDQLCSSKCIGN